MSLTPERPTRAVMMMRTTTIPLSTAHLILGTMLPKVKKQNLLKGTFWSSF